MNLQKKNVYFGKCTDHKFPVAVSVTDFLFFFFFIFSLVYSRLAVESPTANHPNYSNWTQTDRCLSDEKATFIMLI